jgi:hypothetical protein
MSSSSAKAPVAPTTPDKKSVTARPLRKAGGRLDKRDPETFIENILPVLRLQAHAVRGDRRRLAPVLLQT